MSDSSQHTDNPPSRLGLVRSHQATILATLLAGQFMVNVDVTIVNVASPSIASGLHASGAVLETVVAGYTLAYAVLLVTGARIGRMFGYRRVFLAGLASFTLASLACGLAPTSAVLVTSRIVQGMSAAALVPQVLTGLQTHFTGARRASAISAYSSVLAGSAVVGQILGGLLVSTQSWRTIFLINVPIGIVTFVAGRRTLVPADASTSRRDLNGWGTAALIAGLALVVVPLLFGRDAGWPAWTWISLAASVPAIVAFGAWQRGSILRGRIPVIRVDLITRRTSGMALLAIALSSGTYFALLFTLAQYLQDGLGHGAIYSGLVLLPWVIAFGVAGRVLPNRGRIGLSTVAGCGCWLLAAAFLGIAGTLWAGRPALTVLLLLLACGGFGLGLSFPALIGVITSSLGPDDASDASGLIGTASQLGGVVGVAGLGTLYFARADASTPGQAYAAVGIACAVAAVAAAGAIAAIRPHEPASSRAEASAVSGQRAATLTTVRHRM